MSQPNDFTAIVNRLDAVATPNELVAMIYGELKRLAVSKIAVESRHTYQATELVHEAWIRLKAGEGKEFQNRAHFFGAAAEAMRRILVDRARRRLRAKRGGGVADVELDGLEIPACGPDDSLLELDEALTKFSSIDARKAELVKLRYFVGMTFDEAAEALNIAAPTAKQWWAYAKAWLSLELRKGKEP